MQIKLKDGERREKGTEDKSHGSEDMVDECADKYGVKVTLHIM